MVVSASSDGSVVTRWLSKRGLVIVDIHNLFVDVTSLYVPQVPQFV